MANLPSPDTFRYSPIRLMELSCSSFDLLEHISLLGKERGEVDYRGGSYAQICLLGLFERADM
jgi:hypothetical protein